MEKLEIEYYRIGKISYIEFVKINHNTLYPIISIKILNTLSIMKAVGTLNQ